MVMNVSRRNWLNTTHTAAIDDMFIVVISSVTPDATPADVADTVEAVEETLELDSLEEDVPEEDPPDDDPPPLEGLLGTIQLPSACRV